MKRTIGMALVIGTMAGVAAMQDGAKSELLAQNREKGVEIRAPKSPGKDQPSASGSMSSRRAPTT